jgi:hypothetical protein
MSAVAIAFAVIFAFVAFHITRSIQIGGILKPTQSSVDGNRYLVRDMEDSNQAADMLALVRQRIDRLIAFASQDPRYATDKRIKRIRHRWRGSKLCETGSFSQDAAFSLNKGEIIALCVRRPDGRLEDIDTGTFVAIHELAHLAVDDNGHTPRFWEAMRYLLKIAIEDAHVYTHQPFERLKRTYCGMPITSSPYSCVKNKTCTVG